MSRDRIEQLADREDREPRRPSPERRRRYLRGHRGEWAAIALLITKGYRILGRRVVTASGEIDVVAVRRNRIAFVEVKRRRTLADAEASITPRQRQRVRRAADVWLARHAAYQRHDIGFDLVFVLPWRLPAHLPDAL